MITVVYNDISDVPDIQLWYIMNGISMIEITWNDIIDINDINDDDS